MPLNPVRLYSRSAATLERAARAHALEPKQRLAKQLITAEKKESIPGRIQRTTQLQEAVVGADLVSFLTQAPRAVVHPRRFDLSLQARGQPRNG